MQILSLVAATGQTLDSGTTAGAWIKDIAYNLNNDLLAEFFRLWDVL